MVIVGAVAVVVVAVVAVVVVAVGVWCKKNKLMW